MTNITLYTNSYKFDDGALEIIAADTTIESDVISKLIQFSNGGFEGLMEYLQTDSGKDSLIEFFTVCMDEDKAKDLLTELMITVTDK